MRPFLFPLVLRGPTAIKRGLNVRSDFRYRHCIRSFRSEINETVARRMQEDRAAVYAYHLKTQKLGE